MNASEAIDEKIIIGVLGVSNTAATNGAKIVAQRANRLQIPSVVAAIWVGNKSPLAM